MKSDEKPIERRKFGKAPTYPFVDSNGVLVTKSRRRTIDVREMPEASSETSSQSNSDVNELDTNSSLEAPSIISDSKVNLDIPRLDTRAVESLELIYQKWTKRLNSDDTRCSLGRDKSCDLVILNRFASRRHGRLEWRNGHFYFCDHSFNGTYIEFDDGRNTHICRDEIILNTSGVLSLGKPNEVEKEYQVRFVIS